MRVVLQRVTHARVTVKSTIVGSVERGLVILVGFGIGDTVEALEPMAQKIIHLRIFENEQKRFDKSLLDIGGELLIISQFTLYAATNKGRRPDFFEAIEPVKAADLYDKFVDTFRRLGVEVVERGEFGAEMFVQLENHGPVTILLES
jgi:D-aminoacyl-tRNA deacylase